MAVSLNEVCEMARVYASMQVSDCLNRLCRDNHEFRMTSQERARVLEALKYYKTAALDIEEGRVEVERTAKRRGGEQK